MNLPSKYGDDIPFVKISDPEEATEYGLDPEVDLPKMILFDNGIPEVYDDGIDFLILLFDIKKHYFFFILHFIHRISRMKYFAIQL